MLYNEKEWNGVKKKKKIKTSENLSNIYFRAHYSNNIGVSSLSKEQQNKKKKNQLHCHFSIIRFVRDTKQKNKKKIHETKLNETNEIM